ncbi:DUF2304 domain-containing protein [Nocardioides cavernae]|uniref:DUF2304 domain-containing protein n=1 Tax=Nocardioides cavernae TaxID=1921566 RepID=A0ABR8NEX5_9ACTN|nr:DUF2304 domain-containing protein [Nocardioides cavernae]MBD3926666.1 DUF2304 domain-containing protein [Nocardioides cavernae]MBM7512388.1 hypothetical protein [Nocardioides cavernae]
MSPVLTLGVVGAVATLVVLFEMLRRQRLREKHALIWVVVAFSTVLLVVFPGLLTRAADLLGVQVPANLLFFVASMLLLLLSIQFSYEIGRLEDRTRTLAEEVALLTLRIDQMTDTDRPTSDGADADGDDLGGDVERPEGRPRHE